MNLPIKRGRVSTSVNRANQGMLLEDIINQTNEYYLLADIAVIHKKPTPIQIVKVDYPMRSKAVITEAYYKTPSTTDYNGVYKGYYIDFEAKETNNKTAFPLRNIHQHQYEHLVKVDKHNGIAFMIVCWKQYNEFYLLPINILKEFWDKQDTERKSIPYQVFCEKCIPIYESYTPRLDYLKAVSKLIENKIL